MKWQAPPRWAAGRPPSARYESLADRLLTKPGKWALVGDYQSRSAASYIKTKLSGRGAIRVAGALA